MDNSAIFHSLKAAVLLKYKEHFPYFIGSCKTFTSLDIQNLIELIELHVKQKVSEKWIYTHLKSDDNEKLPRKDMLDILSEFVGFSGWDEFAFKHKKNVANPKKVLFTKTKTAWIIGFLILMVFAYLFSNQFYETSYNMHSLEIQNSFTKDKINSNDIEAVIVKDSEQVAVKIIDSKLQIHTKNQTKIIIKSPFYKQKTIVVNSHTQPEPVSLEPIDYAMMLKAFMKSDIKDWQTRKKQLDKILSNDLEVIVMLKNDVGAEYFNKEEFSKKLIIPSTSLKQMKIVEIENDANKQINFIRIILQ